MTSNPDKNINNVELSLSDLFLQHTGLKPQTVAILPVSGSDRQYYRLTANNKSVIGTYNQVVKENEAFIHFSHQFNDIELPVPKVFITANDRKSYLQTDLGDETLFSVLTNKGFSNEVKNYYLEVVKWLPRFQINGIKGLNLDFCYPRKQFDKQSMMWDFNYFKYYFARLSDVVFDEQALEDDFETLASFLLQAKDQYFMFRDFQSRNIMIINNQPFFIDYQGGRSGPLQYDLASLLYDAKANLSVEFRKQLINAYLEQLTSIDPSINQNEFMKYFNGFVLIRILQALGAYGFRGYYQKKQHFLQSIPYAYKNLNLLFADESFTLHIPELKRLLIHLINKENLINNTPGQLKVKISSFSYKKGIPTDQSGNGGGYVFDCRALPNPGRHEEYKQQSGLDEPVITYLAGYPEVDVFLENVFNLIDLSINNYMERGFEHLMVNFGCTGGRHRSVYCANKLVEHVNQKFGLNVQANHSEKPNW